MTPFLKHPGFKEFKQKTPRLQELIEQIQLTVEEIDRKTFISLREIKLDEKTKKAFQEFAEICQKGLKLQ